MLEAEKLATPILARRARWELFNDIFPSSSLTPRCEAELADPLAVAGAVVESFSTRFDAQEPFQWKSASCADVRDDGAPHAT